MYTFLGRKLVLFRSRFNWLILSIKPM